MPDTRVHVLHLIASRQRRGAEVFASDLVGELAAVGVRQTVVALRDHDTQISFEAPTSSLQANQKMPLRIDVSAIRRLRRALRTIRPSVVQAHGGEALKYALPAVVRTGIPVAYRRIGSTTEGTAGAFRLAGHLRLVRRAAVVIAVSDAAREDMLVRFGVDPRRVVRIPNAVNVGRATPNRSRSDMRRELGLVHESELVVSVGALNWEKDPLAQIDVFERVAAERPHAVLVMVGEGPLDETVRLAVNNKGLAERVLFLGTRDDVPDILRASDVLMLASRTEGMPGVVIEAGIAGLPVAAYALAGVPEIVSPETGLLAKAGDRERLATSVAALLADSELRARMGRAAYKRCSTEFSIPSVAARYLDVYERLTTTQERPASLEPTR